MSHSKKRKKKKIQFTLSTIDSLLKIRKPVAPPSKYFKDKKQYSRKGKYGKGWGDSASSFFCSYV